ncbi:MAG TPA: hypothetical protein VJ729_00110 [Nitrososphaeraceae archaeon]|nr:hypothetical protein [Nitrososphaeraceae archaeon]
MLGECICYILDSNNKQFLMNQMMWFAISIAISITISLLLPFPISLVVIIGVFILLNFYMINRTMRRMGIRGRGMFGSMFADNSLTTV